MTINSWDGTQVLDFQGMLLSSWLNIVKFKIYQDSNNLFGIFGLGERTSKTLKYNDGVYSMYNRDVGDPFDDGETPGDN